MGDGQAGADREQLLRGSRCVGARGRLPAGRRVLLRLRSECKGINRKLDFKLYFIPIHRRMVIFFFDIFFDIFVDLNFIA